MFSMKGTILGIIIGILIPIVVWHGLKYYYMQKDKRQKNGGN